MFVVTGAFVVGCGGGSSPVDPADARMIDAPGCGPCSGCCLGTTCFAGDNPAACGTGGAACATCEADQVCSTDHACADAIDACAGIAAEGTCSSATEVALCTSATDGGAPGVVTYTCRAGEMCEDSAGGARCVLIGACHDGDTQCAATTLETCAGGAWQDTPCATGCIDTAIGASCGIADATVPLSSTLTFETRGPNGDPPTDWGPLATVPAPGFAVIVARDTGTGLQLIDHATTDATGAFTVAVPSVPQPSDVVLVLALAATVDGGGHPTVSYAVADPGLAAGTTNPLGAVGTPRIWAWSWPIASAGSPLVITEPAGSPAARVFADAERALAPLAARFGALDPVVVWLGAGVTWSCGTCYWNVPATSLDAVFSAQVFLRHDADQSYWSGAVTAHELGHHVMASYGHPVGEGGRHCFGVPTAPGLAWSEGYATWFSADARGEPRYVDKQQGTLFWFDISDRTSSGIPWPRPLAADGLDQDLYENEVAAMLWAIAEPGGVGRAAFDAALSGPRMTVSPFARGYTRHGWDVDGACARVGIVDSHVSTTQLADFLDAVVCDGADPGAIDAATEPATFYPYPSGAPLCAP